MGKGMLEPWGEGRAARVPMGSPTHNEEEQEEEQCPTAGPLNDSRQQAPALCAVMDPLLVLFCLLLIIPPLAAAQAQQQKHSKQMPSFSATDGAWRPTDDSNRTLVSANGDFAAGFVPSTSTPGSYRFAVWVVVGSNSTDRTGDGNSELAVDAAGGLTWTAAGADKPIWSPVANYSSVHTAVLRLNDTGSLVYGGAAWSSFAEPTDTLMPGQAIPNGSGNGTTLQSAKGRYRLMNATTLVLNNNSLMYAYCNISKYGKALLNLTADGKLMIAFNGWEFPNLIASDGGSTKRVRRLTLDNDGNLRLYSLGPRTRQWCVVWQLVQNRCTILGTCADGRICIPVGDDSFSCICPPGYRNSTQKGRCEPKNNHSGRGNDDTFLRMDFVVFSGGATIGPSDPGPLMRDLTPQNQEDCESFCRQNATCVAYGYKFGGDGARTCHQYMGLVGGYWSPVTEMSTFLRVVASENYSNPFTGMTSKIETVCAPVKLALPAAPPMNKMKKALLFAAIMAPVLFVAELLAGALSIWVFLRKYSRFREMAGLEYLHSGGPRRFSYAELKAATRGFSDVAGRGAYGTVYRGELADRRAVAVKELHGVGGGDEELWAEVTIIARLHHLNLVRLCGFCADRGRRMLVYEYVPNGSLDKYLFAAGGGAGGGGAPRRPLLEPRIRYRIALGVARAIAYLHEECLEWVLHCDIKPENILLEDDFCPKVSDFGLSKLTKSKQDKLTMSRIRGTRGYLAPEWVIHGEPITAKADVYSFGMVLLEIVSGRRSYGFRHESVGSEEWYFPKWAYEKLYVERRIDDILDPGIAASYDDADCLATVERMVKTAMWCLQDRAEMRPSMGRVAKMLEGSIEITDPVKPTIFCLDGYCSETMTSTETPPAPMSDGSTLTD
ncbi:hypothetical protein U9M48_030742 [Paspalum notatum var. saurae]|uniref:non-specific serine/threonine protein kinase n=1 Tax=Paspalum notatum var. saurae TaxID=547442 RepID=A0AAQ3U258_PASNO